MSLLFIGEKTEFKSKIEEASSELETSALKKLRELFLQPNSNLSSLAQEYLAKFLTETNNDLGSLFFVAIQQQQVNGNKKTALSITLTDQGQRLLHQVSLVEDSCAAVRLVNETGWSASRITRQVFTLSELKSAMSESQVPGDADSGTWKKYLEQFTKWEKEREEKLVGAKESRDKILTRVVKDFPGADINSPLCKIAVKALAKLTKTVTETPVVMQALPASPLPETKLPFHRRHPILTWGACASVVCALAVYFNKQDKPSLDERQQNAGSERPIASHRQMADVMSAAKEYADYNNRLAQMQDAHRKQLEQTIKDFDPFIQTIKSPQFRAIFELELRSALAAPNNQAAQAHIDKCVEDANSLTEGMRKFTNELSTFSVNRNRSTGDGGVLRDFFRRNPELIELQHSPFLSEEFKLRIEELLSPSPYFIPQPIIPGLRNTIGR